MEVFDLIKTNKEEVNFFFKEFKMEKENKLFLEQKSKKYKIP